MTTVQFRASNAWQPLLDQYGKWQNGVTQFRMRQDNGTEVIGTITLDPNDPYTLIFNPFMDTVPANTLNAINAIIDPLNVNVDSTLLSPVTGTRYLLTHDIGSVNNVVGAIAWRGPDSSDLIAHENDIIEYNGSHWTVSFDSTNTNTVQYVTNMNTGIQYKYANKQWIRSFIGVYPGGMWSIALS
jgi:hypothetical protein